MLNLFSCYEKTRRQDDTDIFTCVIIVKMISYNLLFYTNGDDRNTKVCKMGKIIRLISCFLLSHFSPLELSEAENADFVHNWRLSDMYSYASKLLQMFLLYSKSTVNSLSPYPTLFNNVAVRTNVI